MDRTKEYNMVMETMKIHLIGIGGISMSALARMLKDRGFVVQGSDQKKSHLTSRLEREGIPVFLGHCRDNVLGQDIVIISSAIGEKNPELAKARELSLPVFQRGEVLAMLSRNYDKVVAVSGSHGKTTITAMLHLILLSAGKNPTLHLGGEFLGENLVLGGEEFFLTEACEYHNNFLSLSPHLGIVSNIEMDHPDFFKTEEDLKNSFLTFSKRCQMVVSNLKEPFLANEVQLKNLEINLLGFDTFPKFSCFFDNEKLGDIRLKVLGVHNVENAVVAIKAALCLGVPFKNIKKGLENFHGVKGRGEFLGEKRGVNFYVDYAHHPKQIDMTLSSVKGRKVVLFQPHTFSRTKALFDDFVSALSKADLVFLLPVFPAREDYDYLGCSSRLALSLSNSLMIGENEISVIEDYLLPGDNFLVLGAGNVSEIGREFFANL